MKNYYNTVDVPDYRRFKELYPDVLTPRYSLEVHHAVVNGLFELERELYFQWEGLPPMNHEERSNDTSPSVKHRLHLEDELLKHLESIRFELYMRQNRGFY